MKIKDRNTRTSSSRIAAFLAVMILAACKQPIVLPKSEIIGIPIITTPVIRKQIPVGERIIIADIDAGTSADIFSGINTGANAGTNMGTNTGSSVEARGYLKDDIDEKCASAVKDALMGRLIDNENFEILSRDNLEQIMVEADKSWAGEFNSETAVKLGNLLGASKFIVGRVIYCGPSLSESIDEEGKAEYKIIAAVQVVDLETGKVLAASSSEGTYVPRPIPALFPKIAKIVEDIALDGEGEEAGKKKVMSKAIKEAVQRAKQAVKGIFNSARGIIKGKDSEQEKDRKSKEEAYARMKAAEDLANGFADKFFSRPMWEKVEMWTSRQWSYGESIRYVKLGHCPRAVTLLENAAKVEISHMSDLEAAKHLHNYGVALLCANDPKTAAGKLRAAYRVAGAKATLKMLGLAGKIQEWNLHVEVNTEPVVDYILDRKPEPRKDESLDSGRGSDGH